MKKLITVSAFLVTLFTFQQGFAQEYIYDNLPGGQSTSEIMFTGKWCNVKTTPYFGNKSLEDCGRPGLAEYLYAPNLSNGVYNVYVRWVASRKNGTTVPFTITSSDYSVDPSTGEVSYIFGTTDFTLDLRSSGNTWLYVGRYSSVGGAGALQVKVSNAGTNGTANTDGVRFVKLADYPPPCDPETGIGCL